MYCMKCGREIKDSDAYCTFCGEVTENAPNQSQIQSEWNEQNVNDFVGNNQNYAPRKKPKKLIGLISVGVAVVIVSVILIATLTGGGYKSTIDKYFKAIENNDPDLMYSSVIAQYWIQYIEEGYGKSYALESLDDSIKNERDNYKRLGSSIHITYEITNERHATEKQLDDLIDDIYDRYGYFIYKNKNEMKITDAYVVDINYTVIGENGNLDRHFPDGLLLIKENGKWKITRGGLDNSFYDNQ